MTALGHLLRYLLLLALATQFQLPAALANQDEAGMVIETDDHAVSNPELSHYEEYAVKQDLPRHVSKRVEELKAKGQKPKIIVFWASIGFGHLSASQGIRDEIKAIFPDAEVILKDAREFQPKWRQKAVNWFYDFMTKKNPRGYDNWYQKYMKEGETIDSMGNMSIVDGQRPDRYLKFILEQNPTMVISTQNHITEVFARLRDQGHIRNIPTAQVLTDYVNAPYFRRLGEHVDMSFVPHDAIRDKWIAEGFPADRVLTTGIPVNPKAAVKMTEIHKAQTIRYYGFDPKIPTILITSGSAGVGDYAEMVRSISRAMEGQPVQIIAVAGKSRGNLRALKALNEHLPPNVSLLIYRNPDKSKRGLMPQDQLYPLMKSVDVIVGKTGGLTSTEVATMGKPVVFLDINGGQETFNSNFFDEQKMALTTQREYEVGDLVKKLLTDPELRKSLLENQAKLASMSHPEFVTKWIVDQDHVPTSVSKSMQYARGPPSPIEQSGNYKAKSNKSKEKAKALFLDNEAKVAGARFQMLNQRVPRRVRASYYLFDGNRVGMAAFAQLRQIARAQKAAGYPVDVQLMIDGWAPERWVDARIDPAIIAALTAEGVKFKIFNQVDLSKKRTYFKTSNFNRNHDKVLVVDDMMAQGDRNVQNVNFRLQRTNGQLGKSYRSTETFVHSQSVADAAADYLSRQFNGPLATEVDISAVTSEQIAAANRRMDGYWAWLQSENVQKKLTSVNLMAEMKEVEHISFISDPIGKDGFREGPSRTQEVAIGYIQNSTRYVRVISPYLRLGPELYDALKKAHEKGVKIQLYTVSELTTDAPITVRAFEKQAMKLRAMGFEVYQHQGPDFMHAKGIEVDGVWSMSTSHNFNPRSDKTDFESGLEVRDPAYAREWSKFMNSVHAESLPFAVPQRTPIQSCIVFIQNLLIKSIPLLNRQI